MTNTLPTSLPAETPVLVFSDFDGTITTKDTGTIIIDACMGYDKRRDLDLAIFNGQRTFRDAVHEMWNSVTLTWEDAVRLLDSVELDAGFDDLFKFLYGSKIPLTIVSAGLQPLVEMFMSKYTTTASKDGYKVDILANEVDLSKKNWRIIYRDDTHYGHDKGEALRQARQKYPNAYIIFMGDGVSDLSAAKEANLVFAKKHKDLAAWCAKEEDKSIPVIEWESLHEVKHVIETLLSSQ